jgi:hypothetical protein
MVAIAFVLLSCGALLGVEWAARRGPIDLEDALLAAFLGQIPFLLPMLAIVGHMEDPLSTDPGAPARNALTWLGGLLFLAAASGVASWHLRLRRRR